MLSRAVYRKIGVPAMMLALSSVGFAQDATTAAPDASAPMAGMTGGPSSAIQAGSIHLEAGKSTLLQDVQSFDISNPGIVDAQGTPEGDLILQAKSPGSTTLMIRKTGVLGVFVYNVDVTGVDVENVLKTVKAALGGIVGLQISQEGNTVVLQGDVSSRDDGMRIDRQKTVFGSTILDLTKRTYMQAGLTLLKDELSKGQFRDISADTHLNSQGTEVLVLRGTVFSQAQKDQLLGIADRFFDKDSVVDQVRIDSPLVEVDVSVYSFDLSRLRSIGNNALLSQITSINSDGWNFQTGPRLDIKGNETGAALSALNVSRHTIHYPAVGIANNVQTQLDALNQLGAVSNISQQHASVKSGDTATIQNNEEQNIVIATGFAASLEKVTYGQVLNITPTVVDANRFDTNVGIELSNILPSAQTPQDSALGVARRQLTSTFTSGQGQTVVLGGTKRVTSAKNNNSTPFLAQIPIVNWWFKAKDDNHSETVQVYFMTLFAPTVESATEEAMSKGAADVKQRTTNNADENNEYLKNRQRWEAEGLKTMWTGESRYQ